MPPEGSVPSMSKATKVRLDTLLAQRGVYATRSRAAASVLAGEVRLGDDRRRAEKPGQLVTDDVAVHVDDAPEFVSRGGRKLANALDATGVEVAGRQALDVGASTGGFTDCLLQRGAAHVVALDVAYGELHWRLRNDSRVTVRERANARDLEPAALPYAPDLIVMDVSFISAAKVLPAVLSCAAPRFDALVMVKPQFEAGREHVGKGGVVRDPEVHRRVLRDVVAAAPAWGAVAVGVVDSGLPGPKGNREFVVHFVPISEEPSSDDIDDRIDATVG